MEELERLRLQVKIMSNTIDTQENIIEELRRVLPQVDFSGSLPKSEVIEVFQKLKDAINDKGCCGNAQLIGSIVWNAFEKFGGNNR